MKNYRSSIPQSAEERIVATHGSTGKKKTAEFAIDGKIVGYRFFDEEGNLALERPLKDNGIDGTQYYFGSVEGRLVVTFAEPYRNGLAHGVVRQWAEDGTPIGTHSMKCGTGIDLWRHRVMECSVEVCRLKGYYLHEARYIKGGKWHGFEWWLNEDGKGVHEENHFHEDLQHGIERQWNHAGKLSRGYPRYWVRNERVTKRQYLRACAKDSSLPPFRADDNRPEREFPPEVAAAVTAAHKIGGRDKARANTGEPSVSHSSTGKGEAPIPAAARLTG